MTYASATITGSSTGPADLRTVIENLMTSQGNWEFVEVYTATTFNVRVWRCKATNSWGAQWYLAMITNTAAATNLIFKVFEDYATGTKLAYRGCPGATVLDVASGSGYGSTGYAPEATQWNNSTTLSCPASSFTYRMRVTANGVMGHTSSTTGMVYVGLFNPIWSHVNEFPIFQWPGGGGAAVAGFSRRPGASVATTSLFASDYGMTFFDGGYGRLGSADALCGTRVYGSRVATYMNVTTTGQTEKTRGYLDTDLMLVLPDAAVAVGDTLTIDGFPYVCIHDPGSSSCLFMRTD